MVVEPVGPDVGPFVEPVVLDGPIVDEPADPDVNEPVVPDVDDPVVPEVDEPVVPEVGPAVLTLVDGGVVVDAPDVVKLVVDGIDVVPEVEVD